MRRSFTRPGVRPRYAPDRVCDVRHIRIELKLDLPKRKISGTVATTLAPLSDDVRWVTLDAVEMQIKKVRLAGGGELKYDYDGKHLRVDLGKTKKKAHKDLVVLVDYTATPRRGLYFIGPDEGYPDRPVQVWSQGQDEDSRYWFPCFDSPSEKATSEVIATVPKGFLAISNGDLVAEKATAGGTQFHYKLDVPHSNYLITLVVGEYETIRATAKGVVPAILYYAPKGRLKETQRTLERTPAMVELFGDFTGVPYPYSKYAQIFVGEFIFGGMENTTATTLTDGVLYDDRAALDYDVDSLVAHELAHQWFGDLLTCRDWAHGWLNEGFATYAEYLWNEKHKGRDEAAFDRLDFQEQYLREDRDSYRRPIATNLFEVPIDLFDHHLYEKGGCVLHMLRRTLGEQPFRRAIHHYVAKHSQGSVETRDLARATEDITGRNVDWFFDQWVMKLGHPELKVDIGWDEEKKIARVQVKQTQKVDQAAGPVLFRLPTEIMFGWPKEGRTEVHPLLVVDEQEVFFFKLESRPELAIFDPGDHLLKQIETEKPVPMWRAQLLAAPEAIDRAHAARALGKLSDPESTAALARAVLKDKHWAVRAAAADALGVVRSDAAKAALLAGLATDLPKARRAVVRALGAFRGDDEVAAALAKLLAKGDESYFVEGEAGHALGRTRSPLAFDAITAALERESFQDIIRQHCLRGLAELRDERVLPILRSWTTYGDGHSTFVRRAAVDSLARHCEGRERDTRDAREVLEPLLDDKDFRVQMTAINALAVLGDARACGPLGRLADRDLDGRIKRRARDVIRDLREGRSREEALRLAKDETERLDRELKKMRDRVSALEAKAKH